MTDIPKYAVGIDFGTTKSHISVVRLDEGLGDSISGMPYPTVPTKAKVLFDPTEHIQWQYKLGFDARDAVAAFRYLHDIKTALRNRGEWTVNHANLPAIAPVARFLYSLRSSIDHQYLNSDTEYAVCIPGDVGVDIRSDMLFACKAAGLDNIHLIEEPLAAYVSYQRIVGGSDKNILILDFGGGTCDAALIKKLPVPQVTHKKSDTDLGGDRVTEALLEGIFQRKQLEVAKAPEARTQAISKIQEVKHLFANRVIESDLVAQLRRGHPPSVLKKVFLSRLNDEFLLELPYINNKGIGVVTECKLHPHEFWSDVDNRISDKLLDLLNYFPIEEVDTVVLVGGSSQLPNVIYLVYSWLFQRYGADAGDHLVRLSQPEQQLSIGAAQYLFEQQHKRVSKVIPLLDKSISILIDFSNVEWDPSGNIINAPHDALQRLVNKDTPLPYPSASEWAQIGMKFASHVSNPLVILFEDNKPLTARKVTLPNNEEEQAIRIRYRINEHGILRMSLENSEKDTMITYQFDPEVKEQIDNFINDYAIQISM